MPRIALFAYSFLPGQGGGEQYNITLASGLVQSGEEVFVITPQKAGGNDSLPFPVIRIRSGIIESLIDMYRNLKEIKPDLLHISGPTPIDYLIIPFAKVAQIPIILTYHADFPSHFGQFLNRLIFIFGRGFTRILVQTERDRQNLIKRGIKEKQIIAFPFNGVDERVFRKINHEDRDIDLLFIGKMDREHSYKGHWKLLEIIKEVRKGKGASFSICIVGGGQDLPEFIEKSIREELNLIIETNLSDDELVLLLNRAKTIILPSTSNAEGFGRVILEALFCGVVPILSKYAGSSEIVRKYGTGAIIDPFDIEGTAKVITDLLSDDTKLSEFRINTTKMLSDGPFTINRTVKETVDIYREVIEQYQAHTRLKKLF